MAKRVAVPRDNGIGASNVWQLEPDDYLQVAAMAARGFRHEDVARRLGMGREAWQRLRDEDPKALEAFETGRGELHEQLLSNLLVKAREGNVPCLLFAMKILFGYRENQPVPQEHLHRIRIELPGALSVEQWEKLTRRRQLEPETVDVTVDAEHEVGT